MLDRFLETFGLSLEHVAPLELSPFNIPILVDIDMTVSFATDIHKKLAEVKGGVCVEEQSE